MCPGNEIENCRFRLTYDKIMGVDSRRGTTAEQVGVPDPLGITIDCLRECNRRGTSCQAMTIETSRSSAQRCYALDRSVSGGGGSFSPSPEVSYYEKVCIPERSCGKAWTFERVPGYDLDVNARTLNQIRTRQQCQALCLQATDIPCRSAVYDNIRGTCKLMAETRRTNPDEFKFVSRDLDFLENTCAPDPPNCEYTDFEGRFLPYFDRFFTNVLDRDECRRYCESERDFTCRSYNYQSFRRECSLSADDTVSVGGPNALLADREFFYAERSACKTVRVDCTPSDMLVTFSFGTPFEGRIYAAGNAPVCFEMGNGQTQATLRLPIGTLCGTIEQVSCAPNFNPLRTKLFFS